MLKHKSDLMLPWGADIDILAIKPDPGPRPLIGRIQAGDDAQQRRLARARRPKQRHQFALANVQAHVLQGIESAETPADMLQTDVHPSLPAVRMRFNRHSKMFLAPIVARANSASSDATANAPTKLYSL